MSSSDAVCGWSEEDVRWDTCEAVKHFVNLKEICSVSPFFECPKMESPQSVQVTQIAKIGKHPGEAVLNTFQEGLVLGVVG